MIKIFLASIALLFVNCLYARSYFTDAANQIIDAVKDNSTQAIEIPEYNTNMPTVNSSDFIGQYAMGANST